MKGNKELQEKMTALLLQARAIAEAAELGQREFSAEEREKVKGLMTEAADLKGKLKALGDDEALRRQIMELGAGVEVLPGTASVARLPGASAGRGETIGERFVESEGFKEWMRRFPNGQVPESARGLMSPPVEFRSLLGQKTLITGADETQGGAFVQRDYTGIYEPLGRRPLTLRDLINIRQTASDLVEFVRQTAQVTQAAPTPEANVVTFAGSQGQVSGEKPEGAAGWEKVAAAVKTIAVWVPATKRALSDASQLRGLIDAELRSDLEEGLEDEIVGGDGTGEHFTGLLHTSGVLTQSWDTDVLTTSRKAVTKLRVMGRARATAWLMHPTDAEGLDLLKDGGSRYYYGGPINGGAQMLWRVPIVECEAMDVGTALLGDFRKAVLWDRERATLQVSDSHEDFFVRNMVAILAEMRAAFGVIRPKAFCKVAMVSG